MSKAVVTTFAMIMAAISTWMVHSNTVAPVDSDTATSAHIYEQRVYTTAHGKLPALHARFRDHTNYLFVKHGIRLIGYWTPVEKPNTLVYMLAFPSKEAAEKSWAAFMADEEWKRVWAESKEKAGGPIVTKVESIYMNPTDYSPLR